MTSKPTSVNLSQSPMTIAQKTSILEAYRSHSSNIFLSNNLHTRNSDLQFRVFQYPKPALLCCIYSCSSLHAYPCSTLNCMYILFTSDRNLVYLIILLRAKQTHKYIIYIREYPTTTLQNMRHKSFLFQVMGNFPSRQIPNQMRSSAILSTSRQDWEGRCATSDVRDGQMLRADE